MMCLKLVYCAFPSSRLQPGLRNVLLDNSIGDPVAFYDSLCTYECKSRGGGGGSADKGRGFDA